MAAPTATPQEIISALQVSIDKINGESGQANLVVRALATFGYRKGPKVVSGRLEGDVIRLYQWSGTPAGDIILATGPAFKGKILTPDQISTAGSGIYVLASPDRGKAEARTGAYTERYQPRKAPAPRERVAPPVVTRTARQRVERAAAPVRQRVTETAGPSAASVAEAERAELTNALKALLG